MERLAGLVDQRRTKSSPTFLFYTFNSRDMHVDVVFSVPLRLLCNSDLTSAARPRAPAIARPACVMQRDCQSDNRSQSISRSGECCISPVGQGLLDCYMQRSFLAGTQNGARQRRRRLSVIWGWNSLPPRPARRLTHIALSIRVSLPRPRAWGGSSSLPGEEGGERECCRWVLPSLEWPGHQVQASKRSPWSRPHGTAYRTDRQGMAREFIVG